MPNDNGISSILKHSVTASDVTNAQAGVFYFLIPTYGGAYLVNQLPVDPPAYTPFDKQRDTILSLTPYAEGLWADAIAIANARVTSKSYEFTGEPEIVAELKEMWDNCDGLLGFTQLLSRHLRDFRTTDNGAWVEIERVSDDPGAEIISFNHLDSLRCWRTGNPLTPIYYYDLEGRYHELKWYQCFNVVDMASPRAGYFNSGYCAASRAYRHIRKIASMDLLVDESVTGGGYNAIEFIQGVTETQIRNAVQLADSEQATKGIVYYKGKLIIPVLSDVPVTNVSVPLKQLPPNFDRDEEYRIGALNYAKAVGIPPHDLDPALVARGALGVGAQTQVIEENVAGYGAGDWEKQFVGAINRFIVPASTTFGFVVHDARDQQMWANVKQARAQTRAAQILSGELTVPQAQQMAADDGDILRDFLPQEDVTPDVTLTDEDRASDLDEQTKLVGENPIEAKVEELSLAPSERTSLIDLASRVWSGELDYERTLNALPALYSGLTQEQAIQILGEPPKKSSQAESLFNLSREIKLARKAIIDVKHLRGEHDQQDHDPTQGAGGDLETEETEVDTDVSDDELSEFALYDEDNEGESIDVVRRSGVPVAFIQYTGNQIFFVESRARGAGTQLVNRLKDEHDYLVARNVSPDSAGYWVKAGFTRSGATGERPGEHDYEWYKDS